LADSFLFSLIFIAFHYVEAAVIAHIRQLRGFVAVCLSVAAIQKA
jgi:hypothetical protein